jgi:hypothetical protein
MRHIFVILKNVATVSAGHPFRGKIPESSSGVCAVQMRDVSTKEGVMWSQCTKTTLTGKKEPVWLSPGDILFTARGSNNYAVIVDDQALNLKAVAAPHFFIIRSQGDDLLPEYLTWFLNQEPCQRYFEREAEGSVTKSIRRSVLEETPIAIPSVERQQSLIGIARTLHQEQQVAEQLIKNGKSLMAAIANDLLTEHKHIRSRNT